VPNLEESVAYYTKVLGFPEAFRNLDDQGRPTLVYVQISRDTLNCSRRAPSVSPGSIISACTCRTRAPRWPCSGNDGRT
jgi:catechol 2,3-dioxygenase-like lactoylglutathione lyase family enzyme